MSIDHSTQGFHSVLGCKLSIFMRWPYYGERDHVIVMYVCPYVCPCVTKWARRAVAEPLVAQLSFLSHLKVGKRIFRVFFMFSTP